MTFNTLLSSPLPTGLQLMLQAPGQTLGPFSEIITVTGHVTSVADPDPESGAFFDPWIRDGLKNQDP